MSEIKGKVVIITGASSGLGEAAAVRLAERGARLVMGARREQRLEALTERLEKLGAEVTWRVSDVTDRAQVDALAQAALERFERIDVLVNNAGLMPLSLLDRGKVEEWDQMIDVNIKGVLYGINAVLPSMRKQQSGHIINVSSVAGHVVWPAGTVYCATKHAVRAISEGMRQESRGQIRSTNISPGAVDTELTHTITDDKVAQNINELYKLAIDSDAIARAIEYAMEQPPEVDVNELIIRPTAQEM